MTSNGSSLHLVGPEQESATWTAALAAVAGRIGQARHTDGALVHRACDRLDVTLEDVRTSRRDCFRVATELWFLARSLQRDVDELRALFGVTREVRVAQSTIERVEQRLTAVRPSLVGSYWPTHERTWARKELATAVRDLRFVVLVLAWARTSSGAGARRLRLGLHP
jgi:hypothetical protein